MNVVFLTDGAGRKVQIGKQSIVLKHTRNMATAGRLSGLVIHALRHLGRNHVDDTVLRKLQKRLSSQDRKLLQKDQHYAPVWIAEAMRRIAQPEVPQS